MVKAAMDDFFDGDPRDMDTPGDVVLLAGSGILDDEEACACWCDCQRRVEWPGDTCRRCEAGEHRDPFADAAR
jgi:hypothetical protein